MDKGGPQPPCSTQATEPPMNPGRFRMARQSGHVSARVPGAHCDPEGYARDVNTGTHYAEHRPYAVPDRLEALAGPVDGTVTLPSHLDWSGAQRTYRLEDPTERNVHYERVVREALTIEDLVHYLNAEVLAQVWGQLYLPARVREAWERRFSALADAA